MQRAKFRLQREEGKKKKFRCLSFFFLLVTIMLLLIIEIPFLFGVGTEAKVG
jgi:hypothetical protein